MFLPALSGVVTLWDLLHVSRTYSRRFFPSTFHLDYSDLQEFPILLKPYLTLSL